MKNIDLARVILALSLFISLLIPASTALMVHLSANGIPFWDSWDSYKGWINRVDQSAGAYSYFKLIFEQHNDHRIALTRILFLIDDMFSSGNLNFLLAMNIVIPGGLAVILMRSAWSVKNIFWPIIIGCLFLFTQSENFTWEFQAQFFLAQYVPLIGYIFLFSKPNAGGRTFLAILFFAVISMFTMANGNIFCLPLILYFAVYERSYRKSIYAIISFSLVVFLYVIAFIYHKSNTATSIDSALSLGFGLFVKYLLAFFGNYLRLGGESLLGVIFVASFLFIAVKVFIDSRSNKIKQYSGLEIGFFLYITYYVGSAILIASSRAYLGEGQALSGRYVTPTVLAWLGLFIILHGMLSRHKLQAGQNTLPAAFTVLLFTLMLAASQFSSISAFPWEQQKRRALGMLAMALDIGGNDQTASLYPSDAVVRGVFNTSETLGKDYTHEGSWSSLAGLIGQNVKEKITTQCKGEVVKVLKVRNGYSIIGWVAADQSSEKHIWSLTKMQAATEDGQIIGAGYLNVADARIAGKHSFEVLVDDTLINKNLKNLSIGISAVDAPLCTLSQVITLQFLFLPSDKAEPTPLNVVDSKGFDGGDFLKTTFPTAKVIGSYINSDADVGYIDVVFDPEMHVRLRTGPGRSDQVAADLIVNGELVFSSPVYSTEFADFSFNPHFLQGITASDSVIIRFRDDGQGWGEWLAIVISPT